MSVKQILLIGDDYPGVWHPLEQVAQELEQILEGELRLTVTQNYDDLSTLDTTEYAACISYADIWTRTLTSEQIAGLLKFVAGGGGLLAIHNGISLAGSYELLQVIGAKFITHPPYQQLHFIERRMSIRCYREWRILRWMRSHIGLNSIPTRHVQFCWNTSMTGKDGQLHGNRIMD